MFNKLVYNKVMSTKLVGILNLTPDSFSDGGQFFATEDALSHALELVESGAYMIDIGGQSTRPGAESLSAAEEWRRLEPTLRALAKLEISTRWSLDTLHPENIQPSIGILGQLTINNVAGFYDPAMIDIAARTQSEVIVSHLPLSAHGDPQTAHKLGGSLIDDPQQVLDELNLKVEELVAAGVNPENIILDPGIGFGKTPECNRELLKFSQMTNFPVMIGYSRKRFLGENRMNIEPNLEAGRVAVESGAAYLRVHDVAAHAEMITRLSLGSD